MWMSQCVNALFWWMLDPQLVAQCQHCCKSEWGSVMWNVDRISKGPVDLHWLFPKIYPSITFKLIKNYTCVRFFFSSVENWTGLEENNLASNTGNVTVGEGLRGGIFLQVGFSCMCLCVWPAWYAQTASTSCWNLTETTAKHLYPCTCLAQ